MSQPAPPGNFSPGVGVPQYQAIAADLRRKVLRGELLVGAAIPSELALARQHGVSRMTARHAVSLLVNQGLLERRHGTGTFVMAQQIVRGLSSVSGFKEDLERDGLISTSRTLSLDQRPPTRGESQRLMLGAQDPVWDLVRVRSADGVTIALQYVVIPVRILPSLDSLDLERESLYGALAAVGAPLEAARQRIEAVVDTSVADLLEVPHETAFLRVTRISSTVGSRPVEWLVSHFVGDVYAYDVELH